MHWQGEVGSDRVPSLHPSCTSPTVQVILRARPHTASHRHATALCGRRTDTLQLRGSARGGALSPRAGAHPAHALLEPTSRVDGAAVKGTPINRELGVEGLQGSMKNLRVLTSGRAPEGAMKRREGVQPRPSRGRRGQRGDRPGEWQGSGKRLKASGLGDGTACFTGRGLPAV